MRQGWVCRFVCATLLLTAAVPVARAEESGRIVGWGGQVVGVDLSCGYTKIAGGFQHSLGLKSDGSIVAWGWNQAGMCSVPSPNADFVAVDGGAYHTLALKSGGVVVAWGGNDHGQCSVPTPNRDFTDVAAGDYHSLGLKSDGSIVAWGYNEYGQCDVPSPNTGFVAVACGENRSLGIKSDAPAVGAAKLPTDGAFVCIHRAIVSAAWPDVFYIEADNRKSGVRVQKAAHGLTAGKRANVGGIVSTNADGERCIDASYVYAVGAGAVQPLAVTARSLGGGGFAYDPGPPIAGQQGVAGGSGLSNIGLLVRTCGRFTRVDQSTFTIDDGSRATVKCVVPAGVILDPSWQYVCVTGISTCEKVGDELCRLLRVRGQADIAAIP